MLKNYCTIAIRNILKYKAFSLINIFGLAVGMSVCMLIILMLADQGRYDQFHQEKDRIYRILSNAEGSRQPYATSPYPLGSALKAEYPIVEETTRLTPEVGGDVFYKDKVLEMRGYFAEPSFFSVFSFELAQGNKQTALTNPRCVVISRQLAHLLFGKEDPLGKTVAFSDRQLPFPIKAEGFGAPSVSWGNFVITGVIDEGKYASHLRFDVLMSNATLLGLVAEKKIEDLSNDWEWYYRTYTYVLLQDGKSKKDLSTALSELVARKYAGLHSDQIKGFTLAPQPLGEVALGLVGNDTDNRMPRVGYYFLSFLALVVMLSASLNYTNLSIARALTRAKEIGIRKVAGADRRNLIAQFLSESIIMAMLALCMAGVFLLLIVPSFKGLWVNQYLGFELPASSQEYLMFAAFALSIGIVAGLYPAFYLSNYQPIAALKHLNSISPGKLGLRKTLNISQFVISLFFITTSILIYDQFKHYLAFDYGFNTKNIVNIQLQGTDHEKLSNEIRGVPGVTMISATDIIPSTGTSNGGDVRRTGSTGGFNRAYMLHIDENFIDNLGIKLVAGRNLPAAGELSRRYILVNESAVTALGFQRPSEILGEVFEMKDGTDPMEVIGVVKDFRFKALLTENKIGTLFMQNRPKQFKYLNVQLSTRDLKATLEELQATWKKIDPIHPFKYEFFDEQLEATHEGIFDVVSIIGFIAFLAVVIACLGLLGMATYTVERKAKEVGIRKILGAPDFSILMLLSKGFFGVLVISVLVGAPLSYFLNNLWLQRLPNRVEFGVETVVLGIVILLVLGLVTIGSQTIRASKIDAVDVLKLE